MIKMVDLGTPYPTSSTAKGCFLPEVESYYKAKVALASYMQGSPASITLETDIYWAGGWWRAVILYNGVRRRIYCVGNTWKKS